MTSDPKPSKSIIQQELTILGNVRNAVREAALRNAESKPLAAGQGVKELRDEAATAHVRDLPSLFDQLHVQHSLAGRSSKQPLPDMRTPYFAHLTLEEDGKQRDVLIGQQTFIDTKHGVTIVDWKNAPIAKIFFNYRQGEFYCEDLPGRVAEGKVVSRRVLAFQMGELVRIEEPGTILLLDEESKEWQERDPVSMSLAGGEGSAERGSKLGTGQTGDVALNIAALLDPKQYDLLMRDADDPLLILGSAGCGKTTVGLHRIAALNTKDPRRFAQDRILLIVPEPGLVRLSRRLLDGLGMNRIRISAFDDWMSFQGSRLLPSLPRKIYRSTPARVVRFKLHPAVRSVFPDLAALRVQKFRAQIEKEIPFVASRCEQFLTEERSPLSQRLRSFQEAMLRSHPNEEKKIRSTFTSLQKQLANLTLDRAALWKSRSLLEKIISESNGELPPSMVGEVLKYSNVQLFEGDYEQAYSNVDKESQTMLDGSLLADEVEEVLEGSIDVEDYCVFLQLDAYYQGSHKLPRYSHLMIDEAQELTVSELGVLSMALASDAAVTVAGDSVQQTDPTSSFAGWETILKSLNQPVVSANTLTTNYRSPKSVCDLAHDVLGPIAPAEKPVSKKDGAPVLFSKFADEGHASMVLAENLEELVVRERKASVAVITSDFEAARHYKDLLAGLGDLVRLVRNGNFSFEPGIDICDVAQAKGLEFDYVVVPDATIDSYPDTPGSRRLLHVALTRAMHQLWVIAVQKPFTPVVPENYLKNLV